MKKISKKNVIIILISLVIILIIGAVIIILQNKYHFLSNQITKDIIKIKEDKTVEGEKLIIKDRTEFNKIIEYYFENDIVKRIRIYDQFENKEEYEKAKESYKYLDGVSVLRQNDEEMYIFIEKKDFGSDANLSYEEIYNKYLVQIIDAYELMK